MERRPAPASALVASTRKEGLVERLELPLHARPAELVHRALPAGCTPSVAGLFDARFGWSYQALHVFGRRHMASMHYHRSHIALVRLLEARCPDVSFATAAERWQSAMMRAETRVAAGPLKTTQTLCARSVRRFPLKEG